MTSFDEVFAKQNQLIFSLSRALSNFKKLDQSKVTFAITTSRMDRVKEHFSEVWDLDARLMTLADDKIRMTHP